MFQSALKIVGGHVIEFCQYPQIITVYLPVFVNVMGREGGLRYLGGICKLLRAKTIFLHASLLVFLVW